MSVAPASLSEAACFRQATSYLARRAASKQQLRRYLLRKCISRDPDAIAHHAIVEAVLARLEDLKLLDDASLAQSRARTLAAKGFSARRLRNHLAMQGFDLSDPGVVPSLGVTDEDQAVRFAQRKRLGPFAPDTRPSVFERDVRSLIRAGFSAEVAIRVLRRLGAAEPDPSDEPDVNDS